ncbi:hypothetical protein C2E23DRAFT_626267 [Lenzites betulinus]|nr:hypothetical protein C2E23DRAFT_626267 [Lenzites betulinus]
MITGHRPRRFTHHPFPRTVHDLSTLRRSQAPLTATIRDADKWNPSDILFSLCTAPGIPARPPESAGTPNTYSLPNSHLRDWKHQGEQNSDAHLPSDAPSANRRPRCGAMRDVCDGLSHKRIIRSSFPFPGPFLMKAFKYEEIRTRSVLEHKGRRLMGKEPPSRRITACPRPQAASRFATTARSHLASPGETSEMSDGERPAAK